MIEPPSITKGDEPDNVPNEVASKPVKLEPSPLNAFAVMVPVVIRLSLPNEISSDPDLMVPSLKVRLPIEDPDASVATPELNVPLVDRFSFPNAIAPSESVMLPVAKVKVPAMLPYLFTVKSLVTVKFSD